MTSWQSRETVESLIHHTLKSVSDFSIEDPPTGNVGMPCYWITSMLSALMDEDPTNNITMKRFAIRGPEKDKFTGEWTLPNRKTLWYLADIVRKTDTPSCYNTHGSLSEITGGYINDTKEWKIFEFYKKFLIELSLICGNAYDTIYKYDISMRSKRARFNNASRSVTDPNTGRSFVFLCYEKGTQIGGFMEITRTSDNLPQKSTDKIIYGGPKCEVCNAFNLLMLCGKCKKVKYCSKEHQKQDWTHHKLVCCLSSQ
jgi:hypothetical protein